MDRLIEEYKNQKRLLAEALVEIEHMKTYKSYLLKNEFVLKLGEPRYELHKLELTIARAKLKLDMMQTCIKFKMPIDTEQIDRQLEKEFEKHLSVLRNMKKEIESVHSLSDEEDIKTYNMQELKELYFSIASCIHPELINIRDKNIKRIWNAAKKAYENGDTAKLKRLQKKVYLEYRNIGLNEELPETDLENTVLSIKSKRESVVSEIESLKKQFPFSEAKMLEDDDAVKKFKKDIDVDIKIANEVLDNLEKQILEKLPAPGKYLN
ncbi:hypothetical protein LY28_01417 [Ruminiclostridium sufflavum DSM 19573]|uniref:Uncharacterized protein n=1 Tax=Ruminiclostridium sufflavum DSM 19573 TaxID=1121337 RepID=A0A318XP06_9FIRM|nr:hypothetical protein [Ruminiclostridium sufflavum]PYG88566.1 hypothetical protein LY28_01417 [Ruminiclostridium sufflavum DSM 19573]